MSTRKAYLTIDDGPTKTTTQMVDFLTARGIPALLFCRGDKLAANPDPIVDAIKKGFVIGNHAYSHKRASDMGVEDMIAEIQKTEDLINDLYKQADTARPPKYFRFPYLDRGMGSWIVDFNKLPADYHGDVKRVFWEGLNFCEQKVPGEEQRANFLMMQEFLRRENFDVPFRQIKHGWWRDTEISIAADCMFTYSTADWMLTVRHLVRDWPCKNILDLKDKIDKDPWLNAQGSNHVVLAHDDPEIFDVFQGLVKHFQNSGFEFLDFHAKTD